VPGWRAEGDPPVFTRHSLAGGLFLYPCLNNYLLSGYFQKHQEKEGIAPGTLDYAVEATISAALAKDAGG